MHNVNQRNFATVAEAAQAQKADAERAKAEAVEAEQGVDEVHDEPVCSEPVLYDDDSYKLGVFQLTPEDRDAYRRLRASGIGPEVARVVAALGIAADPDTTSKVCINIEHRGWCEVSEAWLDRHVARLITDVMAVDPVSTLSVLFGG